MEVFNVVVKEMPKMLEGYSLLVEPTEREVWDAIVEAMQDRRGQKYLKHVVAHTFELDGGMEKRNNPYNLGEMMEIPTGTLRILARVYVEDK